MKLSDPVLSLVLEPKTPADRNKLRIGLKKIADEDPTLHVEAPMQIEPWIIYGMAEAQLSIVVDLLKREFNVDMNVGRPEVYYRETIRNNVREEGKFIRRSGAKGQYGHVWLDIEPRALGTRVEFVADIKPGHIPLEFVPAVEKGVREVLKGGALAGYPLVDIKVTLTDGSYHETDSSDIAFKIAGAMALRLGCKKADPMLLEPIMNLEVTTTEQFTGNIVGDLKGRRAKIGDIEERSTLRYIRATVPLAEMLGYSTVLRSLSDGVATFTMELSHWEEIVPGSNLRAFRS